MIQLRRRTFSIKDKHSSGQTTQGIEPLTDELEIDHPKFRSAGSEKKHSFSAASVSHKTRAIFSYCVEYFVAASNLFAIGFNGQEKRIITGINELR